MPQCPKPSCHQIMHDLWEPEAGDYSSNKMYKKGFAHTNNIINGGLECRSTSTSAFTEKVVLRSELYKYYLNILGLNNSQIAMENINDYTTLCYDSSTNAMQDYVSCFLNNSLLTVTENEDFDLLVYPNPAINTLNISHSFIIEKVSLFNMFGQEVSVSKYPSSQIELNISDLTTGVYTIKIYSENKIFTRRIMVYN